MHARKLSYALAIASALALLVITQASVAFARHHHAYHAHHISHTCGEFMFHRDGRCVDARSNSSVGWSQNMSTKPVW
jgi:hypothetical protein